MAGRKAVARAIVVLLASGCREEARPGAASSADGALPEACAALMAETSAAEAPCRGGDAQCAQMRAEPRRRLSFSLDLRGTRLTPQGGQVELTPTEKRQALDCVDAFLRNRGLTDIAGFELTGDLSVEATYVEVQPALRLAVVGSYQPGCTRSGSCPECLAHDRAACQRDAFCAAIEAGRIDAARSCSLPNEAVGCHALGTLCTGAFEYASDSAGGCWQFGSGCLPAGWKAGRQLQTAGRNGAPLSALKTERPRPPRATGS